MALTNPVNFLSHMRIAGSVEIDGNIGNEYVDLYANEVRNFKLQSVTTLPTSIAGRVIYYGTTNKLGYYNGTAWVYPDMQMSVYDTNGDGRVNLADDSDTLDGQHQQLYKLIDETERSQKPIDKEVTAAQVQALGTLLYDHIRFEERELYPMVEKYLTEAELDAVYAASPDSIKRADENR